MPLILLVIFFSTSCALLVRNDTADTGEKSGMFCTVVFLKTPSNKQDTKISVDSEPPD